MARALKDANFRHPFFVQIGTSYLTFYFLSLIYFCSTSGIKLLQPVDVSSSLSDSDMDLEWLIYLNATTLL